METLYALLKYEIVFLLVALMATVVYKLLRGEISTRGLLSDADGNSSPQQLQLLFFTMIGAMYYVVAAADTVAAAQPALPEIPGMLLALLGVSNGLYPGAEILSEVSRQLRRS